MRDPAHDWQSATCHGRKAKSPSGLTTTKDALLKSGVVGRRQHGKQLVQQAMPDAESVAVARNVCGAKYTKLSRMEPTCR